MVLLTRLNLTHNSLLGDIIDVLANLGIAIKEDTLGNE